MWLIPLPILVINKGRGHQKRFSVMHTAYQAILLTNSLSEHLLLLQRDCLIGIFQPGAKKNIISVSALLRKRKKKKTQSHIISCPVPTWCLCCSWWWRWQRRWLLDSTWTGIQKVTGITCQNNKYQTVKVNNKGNMSAFVWQTQELTSRKLQMGKSFEWSG